MLSSIPPLTGKSPKSPGYSNNNNNAKRSTSISQGSPASGQTPKLSAFSPKSPTPKGSINRTSNKDDSIRKQAERTLRRRSLKGSGSSGGQSMSLGKKIFALKHLPSSAISCSIVSPESSVIEVAQFMAAKRLDACLVGANNSNSVHDGNNKSIIGIVTDKDFVCKIIAEIGSGNNTSKLTDPGLVKIKQVMTPEPTVTNPGTTVQEALELMVRGRFRHLPIVGNGEDQPGLPLGILDVATCFREVLHKIETLSQFDVKASESGGRKESETVGIHRNFYTKLNDKISTILRSVPCPVLIPMRTTVLEATRLMKTYKRSAVATVDENGKLKGIFTSKDVVLRVLAAGLDPATTSVVRVVTPNPIFATPETSMLDALKVMYDGGFLHLPIVDSATGKVVEVLDILDLITSVFKQIQSNSGYGSMISESNKSNFKNNLHEDHLWDQLWETSVAADDSSFDQSSMDDDEEGSLSGASGMEEGNILSDSFVAANDQKALEKYIFTYKFTSPWGSGSISGQGFDFCTLWRQIKNALEISPNAPDIHAFFLDKNGKEYPLGSDQDLIMAHRQSLSKNNAKNSIFTVSLVLKTSEGEQVQMLKKDLASKKNSVLFGASVGTAAVIAFAIMKNRPNFVKDLASKVLDLFDQQ